MAVPPVAATLAAATAVPVGSMGWIDSLLKSYEIAIEGQEIESLLHNAQFVIEEEAVKIGIEEIKKKAVVFMKYVEDQGKQADMCSRNVPRARTVVLQRIIKYLGD